MSDHISDEEIAAQLLAMGWRDQAGNLEPGAATANYRRALQDLQQLRTAHTALLATVREAVAAMRGYDIDLPYPLMAGLDAELRPVENWNGWASVAYNAIRALADAAAAEPRAEEGT